jgi:hypothetical protein
VAHGARALPADLADFLQSGVSILVGTRDSELRPAATRGMGASIDPECRTLTLYLPEATAERTLANLRDNGRIAMTFSRAIDHRSIQIKGKCTLIRAATAAERAVQGRYLELLIESFTLIGLPRRELERATYWPSFAVEVAVGELYEQTPGPQAGSPLVS